MSVSAIPSASPSEFEPPPRLEDVQRAMLVLKRQQDIAKIQGEALVQLIEQAPPPSKVGRRVNAYA